MSRSYKKAIIKDHNSGMKRIANKAVRNQEIVPDGGGFKKVFCSYSICDYLLDYRFDRIPFLHRGAKKTRAGWVIPK